MTQHGTLEHTVKSHQYDLVILLITINASVVTPYISTWLLVCESKLVTRNHVSDTVQVKGTPFVRSPVKYHIENILDIAVK
jgi:hypothetical protein